MSEWRCAEESAIGPYRGVLAEKYRTGEFEKWIAGIGDMMTQARAENQGSRNTVAKIEFRHQGDVAGIFVKSFGRESALKNWVDRFRGSKARRTWLAADFLTASVVGTPVPVGYLERRAGGRLVESYYFSEFAPGLVSFKDELIRLFNEDPECAKFMMLMDCVAQAIGRMHCCGFLHNDMGNQNILLRRTGDGAWADVMFVDLNRGRILPALSERQRARDISRISLPSDLLRVFIEMYWAPEAPPSVFQQWERIYRRRYAMHSATRRFRHPVRSLRPSAREKADLKYPHEMDMWIWDERSAQPINVLRSPDRRKYQSISSHMAIAAASVRVIPTALREYRALMAGAYSAKVDMTGRCGIAIEPAQETIAREVELLDGLGGRIPVLLRAYHHRNPQQRRFTLDIIRKLAARGHKVSVALVQDRKAVLDGASWRAFVDETLTAVADCVEMVEVCHAINRVKWGIWRLDEYRRLVETVAECGAKYPGIAFVGPAVIDFEYPYLAAALGHLPDGIRFSTLSHHLYVDRRGAPENPQAGFSAVEKFALARAIGRASGVCGDRLIVSEVNWPIKGTGVYSPVGSPYESPGLRFNDPSVSEETYASYMVRYLAMAAGSGLVERVYWWRLVAHGFGLVDDRDAADWRKRPAYEALKTYLSTVGSSRFENRLDAGAGRHLLVFSNGEGGNACLAWSSCGDVEVDVPASWSRVLACDGSEAGSAGQNHIRISGAPVYLAGFRMQK